MKYVTVLSGVILLFFVALRSYQSHLASASPNRLIATESERFAYASPQFTRFVEDSYEETGAGDPSEFFQWLDEAYEKCDCRYPGKETLPLKELLEARREELCAISDSTTRAKEEIALGAWLHKMIKKVIPRFSLDRGFEFSSVVRYGQRQCFLQSVLIAGLLQEMDVYAGVAMVYRNIEGKPTNNGHAVALLKLADGRDIIVDASDREPFARQQGLMARTASGYRYVDPVYEGEAPTITAYRPASGTTRIDTRSVRTLDVGFLRSQFYYYRGERAPGGILLAPRTQAGLEASARYLKQSVELAPENSLAVYQLGRVYLAQNRTRPASLQFGQAYRLYDRFGFIPRGPRDAYARTHGGHSASARTAPGDAPAGSEETPSVGGARVGAPNSTGLAGG